MFRWNMMEGVDNWSKRYESCGNFLEQREILFGNTWNAESKGWSEKEGRVWKKKKSTIESQKGMLSVERQSTQ